jgi:nucleotidyltransferase substrate binding protein (TIGR01987 family)
MGERVEPYEIDFSSFKKALAQLQESLEFASSRLAQSDARIFYQFRNSVIRCFEFSYELAWKMLKRKLEKESPNATEVEALSFQDLIRLAATKMYVKDPEKWFVYRKFRNISSHAYDEVSANKVYEAARDFFEDATDLLEKIS